MPKAYKRASIRRALAIARRMLAWGKATAEEIAKCTALPLGEVLALQREATGD